MSQALGRGLGSLIPKKINNNDNVEISNDEESIIKTNEGTPISDRDRIFHINPSLIKANPYQPRRNFSDISLQELISSIREHGILQPLVVSRQGDAFELIAGERRFRSAQSLGLKEVPVIIRNADKQKKLELALIENLQRQNLDPVETAQAYKRLMEEFDLTQEEAAKKVGKARSTVANTLRLLDLPEEIQRALSTGRISEGHAKYLLGIDKPGRQMTLFRQIVNQNLSVEQTREMGKKVGGTKESRIKINPEDQVKEKKLRDFLGTKAKIRRSLRGGKIILDFYSDEELDSIIDKIENL